MRATPVPPPPPKWQRRARRRLDLVHRIIAGNGVRIPADLAGDGPKEVSSYILALAERLIDGMERAETVDREKDRKEETRR